MQCVIKKITTFFAALIVCGSAYALTPHFYNSSPQANGTPLAAGDSSVITIAADLWCPINCSNRGAQQGLAVDLAKAIFEPLGYKINYQVMPWGDALREVRAGRINAAIGASRFDDATLIFPRQPLYNITDDFFVLKGNSWRFQGMHTLKGKKVGIIANYGYSNQVQDYLRDNKDRLDAVQEASGDNAVQDNIKKLINNQIDVIIEARPVMEYNLMKMNLSDKVAWAGSVPQSNVYLAFSPALPVSQGLADIFDRGMQQLAASGQLATFYRQYGLSAEERQQ